MRRYVVTLLALILSASLVYPASAEDARAADRAAILAIHEQTREAHFERDPEKFLASVEDGYWSIRGGDVAFRSKDEALAGLRQYLDQTTFKRVEDVDPPRIQVSGDGTMAWLIGQVEVEAEQPDGSGGSRALGFRSAWLDVYQKRDGRWRLVARANTQRNLEEGP